MTPGKNANAFAEELKALLAELEVLLRQLLDQPGESQLVVQVFRAMHTIKGTGELFGFPQISRVIREVETAFDQARAGGVPVTRELIDQAMAAQGRIRDLLEPHPAPPPPPASEETILIIDGDENTRAFLFQHLAHRGLRALAAGSVDEGMDRLQSRAFDLIFLEILPEESGHRRIFHFLATHAPGCPVILVTFQPTVELAAQAARLGAVDFLPKPIQVTSLLQALETVLARREMQREREEHRLHLEGILNSVQDAILTVDRNLMISSLNDAAMRLFGLRDRAMVGHPFSELPCASPCIDLMTKVVSTRVSESIPRLEWQSGRGESRVVTVTTAPLVGPDQVFRGGVLVIRDETRLDDLERTLGEKQTFHHIIGQGRKMRQVFALIEKLVDVESSVLITGETGTGKELVAEALHFGGARRYKPLVKVNCSALPETLLESELFGHVKGAFTGAVSNKAGRFEAAHGGTLFLDEIGEISPALQAKLLRAIQEKSFERVGSSTNVKVDVRIVAATNRDLARSVAQGLFREDLFYRLKVVEIHLPPLRERGEDISLLVRHFLDLFNKKFGKKVEGVSRDVQKLFLDYPWPGNVRQLQHALERAILLCGHTTLTTQDLPPELLTPLPPALVPAAPPPQPVAVEEEGESEEDRSQLLTILEQTRWHKTNAARALGISRQTLYRKMRKYGFMEA